MILFFNPQPAHPDWLFYQEKQVRSIETTEKQLEKAVLAGLAASSMDEKDRSCEETMEELEELVKTAGAEPVGMLLQNRPTPDPGTFLGDGKVEELREYAEYNQCDLAVFDNELSPSQMRVLEERLGIRVLDRTGLILDIFAQRARTREGQLQVELAQYQYLLPRLTGMWTHLVRQTAGGGKSPVGTRGPGETQLETDRRHIRRKIQKLEEELEDVRKIRANQRRSREKNNTPVVCLVGYTNAGKSTLLNQLTGAEIPANDRLFDTLDTTTRKRKIGPSQEIMISDTVGFIRHLPTTLVEAFKATLEELEFADVIVNVIDISNPDWPDQAEVVEDLLRQLQVEKTPCIRAFNKCDKYLGILPHGEDTVCISAKTGEGIDQLIDAIRQQLERNAVTVTLQIPYSDAGVVEQISAVTAIQETSYENDGIYIRTVIDRDRVRQFKKYIPGYTEPKEEWEL